MKTLKFSSIIWSAALVFCACGDSNSDMTGVAASFVEPESSNSLSNESTVVNQGTTSNQNNEVVNQSSSAENQSSSNSQAPATEEQTVVEQTVSDPVQVSENSLDPVISFANGSVTIANDNGCITQSEKTITLTCEGNYQLTGKSSDNQVIVNAGSSDKVYVEAMTQLVKEQMEKVVHLSIPLIAEVGTADNWKDAH